MNAVCCNATRATLVVASTQEVKHGHWHGDVAVLDNGQVFGYGRGYVDGDAAQALRVAACGTAALPHTYATPAVTCLVTGRIIGDRDGYRCNHG